jgi:hypothetical protein
MKNKKILLTLGVITSFILVYIVSVPIIRSASVVTAYDIKGKNVIINLVNAADMVDDETYYLPDADLHDGDTYYFKMSDSLGVYSFNISPGAGDTIDDNTTVVSMLHSGDYFGFIADAENDTWWVISQYY